MELLLKRIYTCSAYTIGHLYINNEYFCDTIEDTDRFLFNDMTAEEIKCMKVYGKTAMPCGKYNITMKVQSPKFSNPKYKWAKPFNGYLPRLLNVNGFDGILIHVLNTAEDSLGCIGVGENKVKGKVVNSTITFNKLMFDYLLPADERNENITIEIIQDYDFLYFHEKNNKAGR